METESLESLAKALTGISATQQDIAHLLALHSWLLATMGVILLLGIAVIGWELYGITKALQGISGVLENITRMTAEVLRRTPER